MRAKGVSYGCGCEPVTELEFSGRRMMRAKTFLFTATLATRPHTTSEEGLAQPRGAPCRRRLQGSSSSHHSCSSYQELTEGKGRFPPRWKVSEGSEQGPAFLSFNAERRRCITQHGGYFQTKHRQGEKKPHCYKRQEPSITPSLGITILVQSPFQESLKQLFCSLNSWSLRFIYHPADVIHRGEER